MSLLLSSDRPKPFGYFDTPGQDVRRVLCFPWPFRFDEQDINECRDELCSTVLVQFSDGALLLGEVRTFEPRLRRGLGFDVEWQNMDLRGSISLGDLFNPATWAFDRNCKRGVVRLGISLGGVETAAERRDDLKLGAGWSAAIDCEDDPRGCLPEDLFRVGLWRVLQRHIFLMTLGEDPVTNVRLSSNPHWPLAAVQFLSAVSGKEVAVRRRAEILDAASLTGVDLPLAGDGLRFDAEHWLIKSLDSDTPSLEALASEIACSIAAIRHVLKLRALWRVDQPQHKATKLLTIRALDWIEHRSHWPRTAETLQTLRNCVGRAQSLGDRDGDLSGRLLRWALAGGRTPSQAKAALIALSGWIPQPQRDVAAHPDGSVRSERLFSHARQVESRVRRLVLDLALLFGRSDFDGPLGEAHQMARMRWGPVWLDTLSASRRVNLLDEMSNGLQAIEPWSYHRAGSPLSLRLLRSMDELHEWGTACDNCLRTPWAVFQYLSGGCVLIAAETADVESTPVATLAIEFRWSTFGTCYEACPSVTEIQASPQIRSRPEAERLRLIRLALLDCAAAERHTFVPWRPGRLLGSEAGNALDGLCSNCEGELKAVPFAPFLEIALREKIASASGVSTPLTAGSEITRDMC